MIRTVLWGIKEIIGGSRQILRVNVRLRLVWNCTYDSTKPHQEAQKEFEDQAAATPLWREFLAAERRVAWGTLGTFQPKTCESLRFIRKMVEAQPDLPEQIVSLLRIAEDHILGVSR